MAGNKIDPLQLSVENIEAILGISSGTIWAWGADNDGELGQGSTVANRSSPISVVGEHELTFFEAGKTHVVGIKSDGTAWAWGNNVDGQLGNNDSGNGDAVIDGRSSPISVVGGHSFSNIAAGHTTSYGLKSDGTAWAWGFNGDGMLGDNTIDRRSSPVSVIGEHSFVQVLGGSSFAMGRKVDGTVWNWGDNSSGSIGDNSTDDRSSPVSVVGDHSFIRVIAGDPSSITIGNSSGIKSDGSVWMWGPNTNGSLGDDSTTARSSPVSVIGDHNFISLAVSDTHTLGLKEDGTVWAWGLNTNGQLGQDTVTNRSSPVSVVGGHSFRKIAAGNIHSLGLKADGTLWAWGDNADGPIGDDSITDRSSPVSVVGAFSFTDISCGDGNSYGLVETSLVTARTMDDDKDNRRIFTNEGSTRKSVFQLPSAKSGIICEIYCEDSIGIRAIAEANDTIRLAGTKSILGGYVECAPDQISGHTTGAFLRLIPINEKQWVSQTIVASWDVQTSED